MTEPAPGPAAAWWDLDRPGAYRAWRERVLRASADDPAAIELRDPARLSRAELDGLGARLRAGGAARYFTHKTPAPRDILALGRQLGLERLDHHQCAEADGVARLTAREDAAGRFIPYTRQRLRWHTDGYYQPEARKIRSFILHCARPAADGGVNRLLDPRLLYIALRDEDPELIRALAHPRAFTVPAHVEGGRERRAPFSGAVFSLDGPHLYMRYTERARHIRWRPEADAARARIHQLLEALPQAQKPLRLAAGHGLIAHNVLHCRSAYADAPGRPRLLYRARYADRAALPC